MSFNANDYNITVRRVIVDDAGMFEARVTELPDVRGYGESAGEAHSKAVEAIEALHEMALRDHEEFPEPAIPEDEFSGRVTLRMPKSLHRAIAMKAADEDVSLNWYIVTNLAIGLNERAASAIRGTEIQPLMIFEHAIKTAGTLVAGIADKAFVLQDLELPQTRHTAWEQFVSSLTAPVTLFHQQVGEDYATTISEPARRRAAARG